MQNVLQFSSVVDSLRKNSGSALKSLQQNFEETALKAAGLGEDEEALYKLSKHTQAYLRAMEAMHQAAANLADDFTEATEDIALREVARKFRDASKSNNTLQLAALSRDLGKPVKEASDADDYATRQKLIGKAFAGLLNVNLECFRATSTSLEEAFTAAQQVLKEKAKPKLAPAVPQQAPAAPAAPAPAGPAANALSSANDLHRRKTAPSIASHKSSFTPPDDLLDFGGSQSAKLPAATGSDAKASSNLLDFDDFGYVGTNGTSSPPQRASASGFDEFGSMFSGGDTSSSPQRASTTSNIPVDFDFNSPGPAVSQTSPGAPPPASLGSNFGLNDMSWPTKEEEDESCIKARVDAWEKGKDLRNMLVSLHEVAPSCSGWTPVKFDDVQEPSDVKSVYRRAVLSVHPDKHNDKGGEKILGDLIFKALRKQWGEFRSSS